MKVKELIGTMYFVKHGEKTGQFLVFVKFDEKTDSYSLLGLPESDHVCITKVDIDKAIAHRALEFIDKLPPDVFKECVTEFEYRANNSSYLDK